MKTPIKEPGISKIRHVCYYCGYPLKYDYIMIAKCIYCGSSSLYLQNPISFCVVIAGVPYQGSCQRASCVVCSQHQIIRPRYSIVCSYCKQEIDFISPTSPVIGWRPSSKTWFLAPDDYPLNTGLNTDKVVYDSGGLLWTIMTNLLKRPT
jgi:hypothetical protein